MFAPTSKWGNARWLLFGHRCFTPFDLEGQGAGARQTRNAQAPMFAPTSKWGNVLELEQKSEQIP